MRRTRSAAVTLATAQTARPPATAHEMPVAILDPAPRTVTLYGPGLNGPPGTDTDARRCSASGGFSASSGTGAELWRS